MSIIIIVAHHARLLSDSPVVECTVSVVHEGLGLQVEVEFGRWRQLAGLLQLSSRQIGQCQKSGARHHPFLKTEAGDPASAGRI